MADNSTILEKLDGLVARFEEISTLITDPAVIADQKRYVKLTKEYKELDDLMKARKEYIQLLGNIEEAKNILANESDAEMREMAKEEMDNSQERLPVLEEEIKLMLVPADPQDSKNAILEIRGGAGGDEAAIFAGDLFRMYAKFCETKGWKMEVSNANEGTAGGFKEIVCSVTGDNVYGILKYESGVHRVQRVPATETQGRVHTSAASVAVLPEAEEFDVVIHQVGSDINVVLFSESLDGFNFIKQVLEVLQNFGVSFFGSDFLVLGFFNCGECHETFHRAFRLEAKLHHVFGNAVDSFCNVSVVFFEFLVIIKEVITFQVPVEALQLVILNNQISQ